MHIIKQYNIDFNALQLGKLQYTILATENEENVQQLFDNMILDSCYTSYKIFGVHVTIVIQRYKQIITNVVC